MTIAPDLPGALSRDMEALIQRIEAETGPQPDTTLMPPGDGRALAARFNRRWNTDLPEMARVCEVRVAADASLGSAECRLRVLVPHGAGAGAILLVHGGGFAFCSPETHERCARALADAAKLPVLMPDYRLAPEHPFPAGLRDVIASLRAAFAASGESGIKAGPLLLAGDSAGANLALAAMLHEQARFHEQASGLPELAGALLFYGVYGADFSTPSYRQFADGPGLTIDKMRRYWDWYLADAAERRDPLASPVNASDGALRSLPPLHLVAAGIDPLLSDTIDLAGRLKALGRDDTVRIVPGVIHGFLQMTNALPAAREVLAEAGAAARGMASPRTTLSRMQTGGTLS